MASVQTANEWAIESCPGTQHLPPQKDDSDILATCQTPDALTPYWQARYLALDPATDLLVHVIEGTKKPQRSHKI
ncbi:hypothetical protein VE00_02199 [Pseudogymnoascus sp. WSF 3629]|nr:hypothetical protein VE00_02199 [Pseudogymnoascus sp. WSF 3629]